MKIYIFFILINNYLNIKKFPSKFFSPYSVTKIVEATPMSSAMDIYNWLYEIKNAFNKVEK